MVESKTYVADFLAGVDVNPDGYWPSLAFVFPNDGACGPDRTRERDGG